MDQIAFHESEMMRHFEAGRFASARWHCRVWTRLVADSKGFLNDGTGLQAGPVSAHQAGVPSPINGESRGE